MPFASSHLVEEPHSSNRKMKRNDGYAFFRFFLLSITKFTFWTRKGRGITATSDIRLERSRCRKLWKNSGWTYAYTSQWNSETKVYIPRSFRFPNFGHVWLNRCCLHQAHTYVFQKKRAIMLHQTGQATSPSQLLEEKICFRLAFRVGVLWTKVPGIGVFLLY